MAHNRYVHRYNQRRNEGFKPLEAFGIIASSIAVHGTLEDLQELDKHFLNDQFNKSEGLINEPITKSVSAV
ncbi:hypothetical protein [Oceanobacillus alkalisoli]|uniref:hypothetical protein n=1 Tax=Oceanobacillus alkalisoli TaxID=2925113 RepID=UPI001EE4C3B6|nr:hypothetical protein [Oceanobacillus alkalisoli]MCG5104406.1 hypothetical protein [Oceanobacillus alkalisoli]